MKLNIAIVEDDMIIADTISEMLEELGYAVLWHASRYSRAIDLLDTSLPDLLLLDIQLTGRLDGIDLARVIKEQYHIPYIFLTANADAATIERAKEVKPMAYLTKPVTKNLVFSAIEIALDNYNQQQNHLQATKANTPPRDAIFVKLGNQYRKVYFKEIVCIESDSNYVNIILGGGSKIVTRTTLPELLEQLDPAIFARVHRSFAVNIHFVEAVQKEELQLQGARVPFGKAYRDELFKRLGIP